MPKIRLMSYWENAADHAVFVRNANAIKRIWLRHGADDFRIARVHTGQNTGQYEVTITFADWATFGRASQGATTDDEFIKMMEASYANGKLTERVITVEIELD
jgi:hypothetical protein